MRPLRTSLISSPDTIRRILSVHGHRLAVLEGNPRAEGPPLVFLHGILGSIDFWPPLLPPQVLQTQRWISLGLPGHFPGRLPQGDHARQIACAAFADVLSTAIDELAGPQRVAIVGYSTGGFAALHLAACRPQRVTGVLSISGFAVGRWQGLLGRLQSLAARGKLGRSLFAGGYRALVGNSSIFRQCLLMHAAGPVDRQSPQVARLLDDAATDARHQEPAAMAELFARIRQFDIRPLLGKIQAPVVIAGGDRDPVIPWQQTRALAGAIPHAELAPAFAGAGHLLHLERFEELRSLLHDWAERFAIDRQSACAA